MDATTALLSALGLGALVPPATYFATRYLRHRAATAAESPSPEEEALLAQAVALLTEQSAAAGHGGAGGSGLMVALFGSVGRLGVDVLRRLALMGCHNRIGSILLIEFDEQTSDTIVAALGPEYRDRIVQVRCGAAPEGMSNKSMEQVRDLQDYWGDAVHEGVQEAARVHLRRNQVVPGTILAFVSTGGHAEIGAVATASLRKRFRNAEVYGYMVVPEDAIMRRQIRAIRRRYLDVGARGFMVSDNATGQAEEHDQGAAALLAAWIGGTTLDNRVTAFNNGLAKLSADYGSAGDHLITFETVTYPLPAPGGRVRADLLKSEVLTALREAREASADHAQFAHLDAAALQPAPFAPEYDFVIANVQPEDFSGVRNAVHSALRMRHGAAVTVNTHLYFISQALPPDPEDPTCYLTVVCVRALADAEAVLTQMAAPPPRRERRPAPQHLPSPASEPTVANGHADYRALARD